EYFDFAVSRKGTTATLSVNAVDKDGRFRNELQPQVRVIGPDQKLSVIDIPQVGPGAYETRIRLSQDGSYMFRAAGEGTGGPTRTLEYSYPAEYHFYPPDIQKLRAISSATGGSFQPQASEIFDAHGETAEIPIRLW